MQDWSMAKMQERGRPIREQANVEIFFVDYPAMLSDKKPSKSLLEMIDKTNKFTQQCIKITKMEKIIKEIFKQFCKETERSGGILCHASIGEWHRFLAQKLSEKFPQK